MDSSAETESAISKSVFIRNIDNGLWLDTRMLVLAQLKPLYEFVREALQEKIDRCYAKGGS